VQFYFTDRFVDGFFGPFKLVGPSLLALGGRGEDTQKSEHDNKALHGLMLTCWKPKAKPVGEVIEAPSPVVVEEPAEVKEELAATHTVVKGETLWDIAGYADIYGDPTKWKLIYEANKDILDSPDSLKPGQVLIIPRE